MNALIFAAGLGTRLAHLTKEIPKALVEVNGKPMLLHAIEKMISIGVDRIVINMHHHAEKIEAYIRTLNFEGVEILLSDERGELLETGGGLIKAGPLFDLTKPIVLYNSDVLTGADLNKMVEYHNQKGGIATLMVKNRDTSRYFLFDEEMHLSGWQNITSGEQIITRNKKDLDSLAFSGIHIVEPEIIQMLGEKRKFSITKGYLDLSEQYHIYGWKDWSEYWFDIGTPEKLSAVNQFFKESS
ncbi:nucleotidyltransferase family protein [Plebeiibacterium sediminum]|uniref:Sugar phosphate nucleotidyltransferase n=1 Tax=Plebeiibacterium sediminum TaxID=2992112 RepID=A0AAE3M1R8_9BACT|nr:sugar phosphate nucleotidyltransferase [Plebeiobacterium sediminum]MCW3785346.1 sugar phosphate nucleotidyltransferase [Plebeiobacterium sediminum]